MKIIRTMYEKHESKDLIKFRNGYALALNNGYSPSNAEILADQNLFFASQVLDRIEEADYEASGMYSLGPSLNSIGPVADFYMKSMKYTKDTMEEILNTIIINY